MYMPYLEQFFNPLTHVQPSGYSVALWDAILAQTRVLKAVIFDFDGVFTDNCDYICSDSSLVFKKRSHADGQGVSLLRAIGINVAIITGEKDQWAKPAVGLVEKWNSLPSVKSGAWSKIDIFSNAGKDIKPKAAQAWLESRGLGWNDSCVVGDDLTDCTLMELAGLGAMPCSGEAILVDSGQADIVTKRPGGAGAVRDLANFILAVREIDPRTLALR